jgi:hypothetical protein
MSDSQSPKADSFEQFGSFPPEVRHQVWRSAAQDLPTSPGELSVCLFQSGHRVSPTEYIHAPQVVRQSHLALRSTTKESRDIAKPVERQFRPAEDVLYVGHKEYDMFPHNLYYPSPWAAEVEQLAVPASENFEYTLKYGMRHLPSLKTLYVIFPNAAGESMHLNAKVNLSKEQEANPAIRRMTTEETEKLVLHADHEMQVDLHGHTERVQYTCNVKDRMIALFSGLERNTRNQESHHQPPYWDAEGDKLHLEVVPACFVTR